MLDLFEGRYDLYVAWIVDGDEGARVGQDSTLTREALEARLKKAHKDRDFEEYEYTFVEIQARDWVTAEKVKIDVRVHRDGYVFDSRSAVKKFLAAMRGAARLAKTQFNTDVDMPEWVKKAVAAGWKPPKGWKP